VNTSLSGRTAVIVTTEAIQALHLRKVLGRAGVRVLDTITTEHEIVGSVTSRRPDFVLLDVGIVKSGGTAGTPRALAAQGACTILLSHLPEPQSRALVSEWGIQGYLTKPVSQEQILARLREACPG
jgi:DNA-binding response OmpR family regulator